MDTAELEKLCRTLSLSDEDGEIIKLQGNVTAIGERKIANSLVGKVLSNKLINRDGFRAAIHQMWRTIRGVQIESLGGNKFIFHFGSTEDRRRVLYGGPWSFDRSLIVLTEPTGIGDISKLRFDHTPIWVQIHNIPIICMNKQTRQHLGSMIGSVIKVDQGEDGDYLGTFIRVRIMLDISKPLKRGLRVKVQDSDDDYLVLPLQYERLPEFCFFCGLIGHVFKECPSLTSNCSTNPKEEKFKYGVWMRTTAVNNKKSVRQTHRDKLQGSATKNPLDHTQALLAEAEQPEAENTRQTEEIPRARLFQELKKNRELIAEEHEGTIAARESTRTSPSRESEKSHGKVVANVGCTTAS